MLTGGKAVALSLFISFSFPFLSFSLLSFLFLSFPFLSFSFLSFFPLFLPFFPFFYLSIWLYVWMDACRLLVLRPASFLFYLFVSVNFSDVYIRLDPGRNVCTGVPFSSLLPGSRLLTANEKKKKKEKKA